MEEKRGCGTLEGVGGHLGGCIGGYSSLAVEEKIPGGMRGAKGRTVRDAEYWADRGGE